MQNYWIVFLLSNVLSLFKDVGKWQCCKGASGLCQEYPEKVGLDVVLLKQCLLNISAKYTIFCLFGTFWSLFSTIKKKHHW